MNTKASILRWARLAACAAFVCAACRLHAQLPQATPPTLPADIAAKQALDQMNAGQTADAIASYEKILHDFPTASAVHEAHFRLGYLYYQTGDYDKSADHLKKILQPPAPPELQESAASFLPQVSAAKAAKLPADNPQRKTALEDAVKQYDSLIQKYPNSERMEAFGYGRAYVLCQLGKYDEAATALRSNLEKFAQSESIMDSQYLLANTLAAQAAVLYQANPEDPQTSAKSNEAAKLLGDLIQKRTDLALANDAQFQLGEVLVNRAALLNKSERPAVYANAIAAFRAVQPSEAMVKAQQERVAAFAQRLHQAIASRNAAHLQELLESEQTKLAALKSKPDQTFPAKVRVARIFADQGRYDEARLMYRDLQPLATDDAQKKTLLYNIVLTYAEQKLTDQAVAAYKEFKDKYQNDPIAESLPMVIGALFLTNDPKTSDPDKAIPYFKEEVQAYPKSRFVGEALSRQAAAMAQLKHFDEALTSFKSLIATNPPKEVAAAAQLGIATVSTQTGKLDDALSAFKTVCDKYPGTPQAEQAAYYLGQIALQKGDNKGAIAHMGDFIAKYPDSSLVPAAMFYLATAQQKSGDNNAALEKYKEVSEKYPQAEVAAFSYFQRAQIYAGMQKTDELIATLREFIAKYPDSAKSYFAYDSIGQNQVNGNHLEEAIATYEEFVTKHADLPEAPAALLKISDFWRRIAEASGRYLMLNEEQRAVWNKGVDASVASAEKVITNYSDSPQAALALRALLENQKLLVSAKLKDDAGVQKYFQDLATKAANPAAKSRILFTAASYIYEKDQAKALEQMTAAYDPKLVYAPADIDLYGSALIARGKAADAKKVYEKLAADYPVPAGSTPENEPPDVSDAQSISLYGVGKCLQQQGDSQGAGAAFDNLKKRYPWSPKILEANLGIAQSLYQQKKYEEALALIIPIMQTQSATVPVALRADAMLLGGRMQEDQGHIEAAIDYYIKIASFYEGVPAAASEGLWRGGQLLEKQASGLPENGNVTKSGQFAKAVKAYKEITEKYPASPYADDAAKRLAVLRPAAKS